MTNLNQLHLVSPTDPRWIEFITRHPGSTIFHHPSWIETVAKSYGYSAQIAVLLDQDSNIRAGLPIVEIQGFLRQRRWVSLPFTDHCSPLAKDPQDLVCLLESILSEGSLRHVADIQVRWDTQVAGLQPIKEYIFTTLPLDPDPKIVSGRIKSNDLRKLRAAERHQIVVEKGSSAKMMDEFYRLHLDTRHRKGLPIQPRKFFQSMQEELLDKGLGFIMLARQNKVPAAGVVYLHWKDTLVYKFAASNQLGRQTYASDPVVWEAIRWACENGFKSLDWGRTDLDDEGLYRFKMRWGSKEERLVYVGNHPASENSFKEKLAPVIQAVISKSPLFVSRITGEMLYRFFG